MNGNLSISLCFQGFGDFRRNDTPTDDERRPYPRPDPIPVNLAPFPMNGLTVQGLTVRAIGF